ncbi:MAG: hypothetical protein IRY99_01090 [Isosphaeraceae bacterium]|nr:hypothetical protein [Isosphaeraceae bacterium]
MANRKYDKAREAFASGQINWGADTIKVALVSTSYTPDTAAHQFVSDLGSNRLGSDVTLAGKTATGGVCKATDPVWTSTPTSGTVGFVVGYKDTGDPTTSPLIWIDDTASVNGGASGPISLQLNGGQLTVNVDTVNGFFRL